MKLFSATSLVLLAAHALPVFAQMVSFAAPAPGETLTPGSDVTVELDSADGLTNFQHISVAFGMGSANLGSNMLYAGNYTPVRHEANKPAYQNFTLTVPAHVENGSSLLNVAHFYLVGAGLTPVLEMKNISVMVAN